MRVLIVIVVILNIILTLSTGIEGLIPELIPEANTTKKEIDCTTTYNLYETSLEEFEKYCWPHICQCFTSNGCTKEWSKNFADGLAMMWYFKNENTGLALRCHAKPYPHGLQQTQNLYINPTQDKHFLLVKTSGWGGIAEAHIPLKKGHVEVLMTNKYFAPTIDTKGLFEIKLQISNAATDFQNTLIQRAKMSEESSSFKVINETYFYGTSLQISFDYPENFVKPIDKIVFGPFGGPFLYQSDANFQFNKYTDLNQNTREDYYMRIKARNVAKDYSLTLNKRIVSVKTDSWHYICLGRKINPITKRTHWTGKGCRPVNYYGKGNPKIFMDSYQIYCHCDFQSLGINYVDEDPNPILIPEFQSPEPGKDWVPPKKSLESSGTTHFAVIFTSVILGICLLILLCTVGVVIYYKFLT